MTRTLITLLTCIIVVAGCSSPKRQTGGGYYKDDGPGSNIPANIKAIPDATPRIETHAPANSRPYVVFGKRYVPVSEERAFRQTGIASWYGRKFHGNKTANGETYDMYAMTAAHPTLPLPSYARVTHAHSGRSVIVRINDRGPFHGSRIIDLSYVAAAKLDLIKPGSGPVIVEAITNTDIRNNAYQSNGQPAPKAIPIPDALPSTPPTLTAEAKVDSGSALVPGVHAVVARASTRSDSVQPPTRSRDTSENHNADTDTDSIFLQFGAFSAHENAHRLADSLNQEIAHIEHRRAEINSSPTLHRVQLGPYGNRAQAVNAALRIQSETGREATYTQQTSDGTAAPDRTALAL